MITHNNERERERERERDVHTNKIIVGQLTKDDEFSQSTDSSSLAGDEAHVGASTSSLVDVFHSQG